MLESRQTQTARARLLRHLPLSRVTLLSCLAVALSLPAAPVDSCTTARDPCLWHCMTPSQLQASFLCLLYLPPSCVKLLAWGPPSPVEEMCMRGALLRLISAPQRLGEGEMLGLCFVFSLVVAPSSPTPHPLAQWGPGLLTCVPLPFFSVHPRAKVA